MNKETLTQSLKDKIAEALIERQLEILDETFLQECDDEDCTDDCGCIDLEEDAETGEMFYIELDEETLEEAKIVVRVNSKGKRVRKIKCPPGKVVKTVNGRKVCSTQSGRAKLKKKIAVRKANRTKKSKGSGYKKRINIKRQRALKKREQMGL